MKRKEQFNWTDYVTKLTDLPSLSSQWEKDMVKEITDKISKGEIEKILEVGCSNGRWLRWFCKEYDCKAYGVDTNASGFKKRDVNFMAGDAFNLPYRDNAFDAVFSKGFIEHFKKYERYLLLKEQTRVLKKNGFLICEIPPLSISLEVVYIKCFYDIRKELKHFIITEKELSHYFKELNLEIISNKFLGWFFERFHIPKLLNSGFTSNESILIGNKK